MYSTFLKELLTIAMFFRFETDVNCVLLSMNSVLTITSALISGEKAQHNNLTLNPD